MVYCNFTAGGETCVPPDDNLVTVSVDLVFNCLIPLYSYVVQISNCSISIFYLVHSKFLYFLIFLIFLLPCPSTFKRFYTNKKKREIHSFSEVVYIICFRLTTFLMTLLKVIGFPNPSVVSRYVLNTLPVLQECLKTLKYLKTLISSI